MSTRPGQPSSHRPCTTAEVRCAQKAQRVKMEAWNARSSGAHLRCWVWSRISRCRCGGPCWRRFRSGMRAGGSHIAAAGLAETLRSDSIGVPHSGLDVSIAQIRCYDAACAGAAPGVVWSANCNWVGAVDAEKGPKIVFAFSSPYGRMPVVLMQKQTLRSSINSQVDLAPLEAAAPANYPNRGEL